MNLYYLIDARRVIMKKINKKHILVLFALLLLTGGIYLNNLISDNKNRVIPYTSFIKQINSGNVSDVYISNDEKMKVKLKDLSVVYTENPRTENLKEQLLLKGINVHESSGASTLETVPLSLFFIFMVTGAIFFITKNSKVKGGAFKLSSIDAESLTDTGITFDDIAGNEEAKESIKELTDFIINPEKYLKYNAKMPRGVILYGSPGTGKTLMAKALAKEAGVPFYAVNGSDFIQIYVGVGAGRIRDLFKKAREKGKAVIFIDEIDAIGKRRSRGADGGSDERDQTLNALLSEMSGFKDSQGIIVMAATNRIDVLDEALLRPGRFDRHIEVGLPDVNARYEILKLYSTKKPMADDIDLLKVAKMTVYFSGAKLENLMNEAAILAAREESDLITMEHIDKAYGNVLAGSEKKDRSFIKEIDRKITAYHEAGHALVTRIVSPGNLVRKVTIIPSTKGAGGYTLNIPEDRMYNTRTDLLNSIKIAIGGRASEEIQFGTENITTGAYGDIQKATETLVSMVKSYGMFSDTGLLNYGVLEDEGISSSSEILKLCSMEIKKLYDEVITLLKANSEKLDKIAELLLEKETIYDDDLDKIFSA